MPDISVVHIDQALTDVSIAYRNLDYVADSLFPPRPVDKQSNKYLIYSKDRFRAIDDARRPGARANEIEWTLSTDTYYCEGHALAQAIPDELRANADAALDIDIDTTETLTDLIYLQREILAAAKAINTTTFSAQRKTAAAWDTSPSTPISDVEAAKVAIMLATGKMPNKLLLSYPVFQKIRNHASIIARVQFAQRALPADISSAMLAAAFDVEQVLVAKAIKNTANEAAADSMDWVWGKNAFLCYAPSALGLRTVSVGAQFRLNIGGGGFVVKRYRDESRTADMVEAQLYHDLKVVAAGAGYLFDACIS
mgnify:CR=1 FL=1